MRVVPVRFRVMLEIRPVRFVARNDGTEQNVAVSRLVLGERVNHEINAVLDRTHEKRRCPRVVDRGDDAALTAYARDRRHILDFEGERSRRLEQRKSRVCAEMPRDLGACARVVELSFHTHAR